MFPFIAFEFTSGQSNFSGRVDVLESRFDCRWGDFREDYQVWCAVVDPCFCSIDPVTESGQRIRCCEVAPAKLPLMEFESRFDRMIERRLD